MGVENVEVVRQYIFDQGPNYTDSAYTLSERELAESENMYWDGSLKTVQGAARLVATEFGGTNQNIVGVNQYVKSTGQSFFIAVSNQGKMQYESGGSWTSIQTGLSTAAHTYWDWVTFSDTLIAASGNNAVKKWGGSGGLSNLGGSPPQSRFASIHAVDFVFLAGQTASPSQINYCDTAAIETWPVGNALQVGRNESGIITGLQRFGDATAVFKEESVWLVSGNTPSDFVVNPTPSDVGCVAPNSIVLTDLGIFFWSEGGPALFNGYKTTLLSKRLRRILEEDVDWSNVLKINAAYYPFLKQIALSYPRAGQDHPDRMILLDLFRFGQDDRSATIFWPITVSGSSSMTTAKDSTGRRRIYFGHSNGFVTTYGSGTTFNGETIIPRARTRMLSLGKPDTTLGVRSIDVRLSASDAQLVVKHSADGNDTFATHALTPIALTNAGKDIKQLRLDGVTTSALATGNTHQLEFTTNSTTGIDIKGYEIAFEQLGRRPLL
jgi:hypothetical protein